MLFNGRRCNHPRTEQRDPSGKTFMASHPPIWGAKKGAHWQTKAAAEWPPQMCQELAKCIAVTQPVVASEETPDGQVAKTTQRWRG